MPEKRANPITIKGPAISRKIFGGVFEYDGAGYYPGLELLNLVFGGGDHILPADPEIKITKISHDFARRLVWDDEFEKHPERSKVLIDEGETERALRRMFECLQLEIPSLSKRPTWERAHFFPYTRSLIHWDARAPRGQSQDARMERRYLRGGGALAFRILRMDPNQERLDRVRSGFAKLYSSEESALERLSQVLAQHGAKDELPKRDDIESESVVLQDPTDDLLRDGMAKILEHETLPTVSRIRAVMNWTGFCLVLAQLRRSADHLNREIPVIICDCGASHAQLRRASQRCLKDVQGLIVAAVDHATDEIGGVLPKKQKNSIRSFFWATAATIKLLNAWRGRRHFTLGLDIMETLVLAGCDDGTEMSFDQFLDAWLYEKCGVVVGRAAADRSGLLANLDSSIFEDNENQMAAQMVAAGLLNQYSDATRMVSTGGLK